MSANLSAVLYLVAGVLFILSLRGLSSPASSRQGNFFGMIGMAIAVATTLAAHPPADGLGWLLVILGVAMVGSGGPWARGFGFVALVFACVNIFGGFLVTQRMLAMYKKKSK